MEGALLSKLRQRVEAVLWKRQYKAECIKRYTHTWEHVQSFMDEKGFELYSRPVGDTFLCKYHNDKSYEGLTHRQKERVRHVEVLSGCMETGLIPSGHYRYRPISFEGELGQPFNSFIEEESRTKKASSITRYRERIEPRFPLAIR